MAGDYSTTYGNFYVIDAFASENKVDVGTEIMRKWHASNFPLQAMLPTGTVSNYRFDVRVSNHLAQEYTAAAATSVTDSITFTHNASDAFGLVTSGGVTSSTYIQAGTLLMSKETGDVVLVSADVASGSAATVVRASTGLTVTAGDTWFKVGSAQAEGADIGTVVVPSTDRIENYTQITRVPIGLTGTMRNSEQEYGSELERQRHAMMFEHKLRIEMGAIFGEQYIGTTASAGQRQTRGIMRHITGANVTTANGEDIGGTLTESNLNSALKTAMVRTNQPFRDWTMLCSANVLNAINNFAHDRIHTVPGTLAKYGMNVQGLTTPWGDVKLVHQPFFNTAADNTDTLDFLNGVALIVDLSKFKKVNLKNRGFQILTNRQGNGEDLYKEETLEEWGIWYEGYDGGYLLYGITG